MKNQKKILGFLTIALIVIIAFGYYFYNSSIAKEEKLKITINSWVGFGPLFIAQETGIFEKNNLNVEIIKLENAPDRRAALLSDRVHIVGSSLDDLAVSLSQGIDAGALSCADYSNGGDAIISRKEITSLDTITNFSVAVQAGFVNHFFLLYVLKQNGISTEKLQINSMTPDDAGAAYLAGNVDVAVTWQPHISTAKNSEVGCNILASSADYPEAILDLFIAKKEWINNNQNTVIAFRKSWDESLLFLKNNNKQAVEILTKNLGLSKDDVEGIMLDIKLLNSKEGIDLVLPKIKKLAKDVENIWSEAGYVNKNIDIERSIMFK